MSKDSKNSPSSVSDSQAEEEHGGSSDAKSEAPADKKSTAKKATTTSTDKSNAKETGKILDEISRGTGSQGKTGRSPVRKKGSLAGLLTLLVLILPLIGAIGWLAWQQMQMQQLLASTSRQNQQLQATLAEQSAQLATLRQRPAPTPAPDNSAELAELQETQGSLNNEIRRLQQQLAEVQNRPAAAASSPDFSWKIFEAEFLIDSAARKLQLEGDVIAALTLLEQADAALLAANHAGAFTVRQALADDMARLRAIEIFDTEGIYLRIESLSNNVGQLDLLGSMREDFENRLAENSTAVTESGSAPGWLNATLEFLGDVFVWRKWEERPEAMLAPGQETLIKLNLRLLLEQAQLAVLQQDQSQYQSSLAQAGEWLRRYAVLDSASGRGINTELTQLMALDINPPKPGISASLTAIRQLAESER